MRERNGRGREALWPDRQQGSRRRAVEPEGEASLGRTLQLSPAAVIQPALERMSAGQQHQAAARPTAGIATLAPVPIRRASTTCLHMAMRERGMGPIRGGASVAAHEVTLGGQ